MQIVPLTEVLPAAVEDLHARVLPIGHVHEPGRVGDDVVRDVEAPGIRARLAPRQQVPALGIILVDLRVAVAVGDVDVAGLGADRRVGRPVEGLAALQRGGLVGITDGQEQLALRRELPGGVMQVVGEPDGAVGADVDAVGAPNLSLTPRAQELALAVEDDDRMRTPVEDPHVVLRVDGDARGLDVGPALGQATPTFHRTELHDGLLSPRLRRGGAYTATFAARPRRGGGVIGSGP